MPIVHRGPLVEPILARAPIGLAGLSTALLGMCVTSLPTIHLGPHRIPGTPALVEWDGRRSQRHDWISLEVGIPAVDGRPARVLLDTSRHLLAFTPARPAARAKDGKGR